MPLVLARAPGEAEPYALCRGISKTGQPYETAVFWENLAPYKGAVPPELENLSRYLRKQRSTKDYLQNYAQIILETPLD